MKELMASRKSNADTTQAVSGSSVEDLDLIFDIEELDTRLEMTAAPVPSGRCNNNNAV